MKAGFNFSFFVSHGDQTLFHCGQSLICDNANETLNQVLTQEQVSKPNLNKEIKNPLRDHIKEKGVSIFIPDVV